MSGIDEKLNINKILKVENYPSMSIEIDIVKLTVLHNIIII